MNNSFFNLPPEAQLLLIQRTGEKFDISDTSVEKDIWVCWILEKLFSLPIQLAFKGGTSLSKAFGLINRFSEDVDITIDYRNFNDQIDFAKISRSQLKKISAKFKEQLKVYVVNTALPYLKNKVKTELADQKIEITLSENAEQLRFYYPSVASQAITYLRDHILIEFGIRNSIEPCIKRSISPYLAELTDESILLPKPTIDTLSPVRTFWEKATLIHVECHRDRLAKTPDRLSRHWYDLFMLNNSWVGNEALNDRAILESVVDYKNAFFYASYTNYDDCLQGQLRLIPDSSGQENLARDFEQMIDAGMFPQHPPHFSDILQALTELESTINTGLIPS